MKKKKNGNAREDSKNSSSPPTFLLLEPSTPSERARTTEETADAAAEGNVPSNLDAVNVAKEGEETRESLAQWARSDRFLTSTVLFTGDRELSVVLSL